MLRDRVQTVLVSFHVERTGAKGRTEKAREQSDVERRVFVLCARPRGRRSRKREEEERKEGTHGTRRWRRGRSGEKKTGRTTKMATKPEQTELMRELDGVVRPLASMEGMERVGDGVVAASVQMLSKMVSKYDVTKVTVQQTQRNLYEKSPDGEAFQAKYEELKAKGTPGLDRFLMVLSRIADDPQMLAVLTKKPTSDATERRVDEPTTFKPRDADEGQAMKMDREEPTASIQKNAPIESWTGKENRGTSASTGRSDPNDAKYPALESEPEEAGDDYSGYETEEQAAELSEEEETTSRYVEPVDRRRIEQLDSEQLPQVPSWALRRPYLTGEHLWLEVLAGARLGSGKSLDGWKPSVQELLIMDDLLYAMMGIQGRFVQAKVVGGGKNMEFTVDSSLDTPMRDLVKQMLPLCEHAAELRRFVVSRSRFEFGMVSQAFCAELQAWLHEWDIFIAQLEKQLNAGQLSLQGLWFHSHPYLGDLGLLSRLVSQASSERLVGVGILNMLHALLLENAGNYSAHSLLLRLMRSASAPYFRSLESWIYEGIVNDPYAEFMVVQDNGVHKESLTYELASTYWQGHYTLRRDIPKFLEAKCQEMLTTGKYLNAIRECGKRVVYPVAGRVSFKYDLLGQGNAQLVDSAFDFANKAFMSLLMDEHSLLEQLRSLKHYFLLDQGDFLVHFMDISEEELLKPAKRISSTRLQSLLELALRTSSAAADPFHEQLTCMLEKLTATQLLVKVFSSQSPPGTDGWDEECPDSSGVEMFTLDYRITWPLSLIISRRSLTRYQLLFRHLFHCKYIERELCRVWQTYQSTRKWAAKLGKEFCTWYSLSQQMLLFFQNYLHYITFEVLEPNWHNMEKKIALDVQNVDELIKCHEDTLDTMMKESLLFRPKVLKRLGEIKATCLEFAELSEPLCPPKREDPATPGVVYNSESKHQSTVRDHLQAEDNAKLEYLREICDGEFSVRMEEVAAIFSKQTKDLVSELRGSAHLEQNLEFLVDRLNFNNFYGG